jgi:TetR/AcrR family transcriptional repressor of nem operon
MPRVSKEQASKNHSVIEEVSARLFREQGFRGVSVGDLMGAAGLTHGGFYGHFDSKEALATVACKKAFDQSRARVDKRIALAGERTVARRSMVESYLNTERRDNLGDGCPVSAFVSDIAREPVASPLRAAYMDGVKGLLEQLSALSPAPDAHTRQDEAIAMLSTMVGALLLSRATAGDALSERILDSVRQHLHTEP